MNLMCIGGYRDTSVLGVGIVRRNDDVAILLSVLDVKYLDVASQHAGSAGSDSLIAATRF